MSTPEPFVVIRADASAEIGLGHVTRSLTLATALVEAGCRVQLDGCGIAKERPTTDSRRGELVIRRRSVTAGDPADAARLVAARPDLVVVDGYHFEAGFFDELDAHDVRYAVIDDNADLAARSPVLVLNQNPHATPEAYSHLLGEPRLLLGLDYALIREEVRDVAKQKLPRSSDTIFVAMGGSDPRALTGPISRSLAAQGFDVAVAIGSANRDRAAVVSELSDVDGVRIITPTDYARMLATSACAVLAAGTSLWEASHLATPTVAVIVADNQREGAYAALAADFVTNVIDLESPESLDETRAEIARSVALSSGATIRPSQTIDGRGRSRAARKIVAALENRGL